jgi:hypothetical protein
MSARFCLLAAACLPLAVATAAQSSDAAPAYRWKAKEVYRFDYQKTIQLAPGEGAEAKGRTTEIFAVMILEVESEDANGQATAHLRLASPRVNLVYLLPADAPTAGAAAPVVSRQALRVIEDILTETRWKVLLHPDGRIETVGRPADWRAWMAKQEQSGHWPKSMALHLTEMLEQNFRLDAHAMEDELLPAFGPAPGTAAETGLSGLRPRREVSVGKQIADGRLALTLRRVPSATAQTGARVPLLDSKDPPVVLTAGTVENLAGQAVFDTAIGLPDSLQESYRVTLTCSFAGQEMRRPVTVTYALKRLSPPVRTAEKKGESKDAP